MGNSNHAEPAKRSGVRRFVLTSILTCDQTPGVPHFWPNTSRRSEVFGLPPAAEDGVRRLTTSLGHAVRS